MAEENDKKGTAASPPPARSIDEILADPAVSAGAAPVREAITEAKEFAGEITLTVRRERIREAGEAFKSAGYTYLVDLAGVDYSQYPKHEGPRFAVAYMLYSFDANVRIRLKTWAAEGEPVPSVTPVWKTANWHERETFDMFGIEFEGHPNLERILMWEGFNGYPLRKDFPLRGIDTGAAIYPEIFPEGGGPKEGSTGKDVADVNLWRGPWKLFGRGPTAEGAATPGLPAAPVPAESSPKTKE
jgi:NADH-quinone oxidoreductase subunit C